MSSIICGAAGFILLAVLSQANFDSNEKKLKSALVELKKNKEKSIETGRQLDAMIDALKDRKKR